MKHVHMLHVYCTSPIDYARMPSELHGALRICQTLGPNVGMLKKAIVLALRRPTENPHPQRPSLKARVLSSLLPGLGLDSWKDRGQAESRTCRRYRCAPGI